GDTARLLTLLSADARVTMPPQPLELIGHEAIGGFLDRRAEARGPLQLRPALAARRNDGAQPERQQGRPDHLLRRPRAPPPLRSSRTHLDGKDPPGPYTIPLYSAYTWTVDPTNVK